MTYSCGVVLWMLFTTQIFLEHASLIYLHDVYPLENTI